MAKGGEDIGMDDLNKGEEGEKDGVAETSFTDRNQRERLDDLTRPHMNKPPVTRVEDEVPKGGVGPPPNVGRDAGVMRRSVTDDKKQFLRDKLNITVNKKDGRASKNLVKWIELSFDGKGRVNGAFFDGVKVLVSDGGGGVRYSENRSEKVVKAVERFKALLEEAKIENSNTLEGMVEEINNDPTTSEEVVADIISRASSVVDSRVEEREEELQDQARGILLSEQEVREFIGMLNPQGTSVEKIEALEIQADHYRLKALNEADPVKEQFYKSVSETAELKADSIRIRIGDSPEHIDAISILSDMTENNDLNRLERFKKWARKNMAGLSAVAISVAGILTTIIVAAREAVSRGAKAVGGFAKALANLAKKLGPLLAPLFNLLGNILTWGAIGVGWLANNLWVLAIAMAWLLYDYWKNRKSRK